MKNKQYSLFESNLQKLNNKVLPKNVPQQGYDFKSEFKRQHYQVYADPDFVYILNNYIANKRANVQPPFVFEKCTPAIRTDEEIDSETIEGNEEVYGEEQPPIDYFKPTASVNDLELFLSKQLQSKNILLDYSDQDGSIVDQPSSSQESSYETMDQVEPSEPIPECKEKSEKSAELDETSPYGQNKQYKQYTGLEELSEESVGDSKVKAILKPAKQPDCLVSEQEIFDYYMPQLMKYIDDFEATADDDLQYARKRTRDHVTGQIYGKNVWTDEQIAQLKAYVHHLRNNLIRIHFGPLVQIFKKSKEDIRNKYKELYMQRWDAEYRHYLIEMVAQHMQSQCYVDFQIIGQHFNKTVDSCIETYCRAYDNRWSIEMDYKLTEYVYNSQEKPPFWSVIAFQLKCYELACARRYYALKLDRDHAWSEDETELLQEFWEKFKTQQNRIILKADVREMLPRHKICEVRQKLLENGIKLDRVRWK